MRLSAEEKAIVKTVHDFVEKQVKPVVRELEHANAYPEALIEQMKRSGIFGLADPRAIRRRRRCRCRATSR